MYKSVGEKCLNCAGELIYAQDKTKKICPYCDAEYVLKKDVCQETQKTSINGKKNIAPALKLFQINAGTFNGGGMKTWKELCAWINSGDTVTQLIEALQSISENHTEMATEKTNMDLWRLIEGRIATYLLPDEKMIIYKDSGIFSKGKTGMLVTDKRIYIIHKKKILYLNMKNICSLYKSDIGNGWYFNNDTKIWLDDIGCSEVELGVILALICTIVHECHPDGFRIEVNNQNLSN